MSDDTYAKLMSSIVTSSVWVEPDSTFRVWIAMLALKDKDGFVRSSVPGLANLCAFRDPDGNPVPFPRALELTQRALDTFMAPDPYSQNKANEGRRIAPVAGGWVVLNHGYYRDLENRERRRQYKTDWMAKKRAAETGEDAPPVDTPPSPQSPQVSTVDESGHIQIADTEAKKSQSPPQPPKGDDAADAASGTVPGAPAYTAIFERFWQAYPTTLKGSKKKAFDVWQRKRLGAAAATLIEDVTKRGAEHGEWKREQGRFIPHVTTYLNARTWEEPIVANGRGTPPRAADRAAIENRNRDAAEAFAGDEP